MIVIIENYEPVEHSKNRTHLDFGRCSGCGEGTFDEILVRKPRTLIIKRCKDCQEIDKTPIGPIILNYKITVCNYGF